MNEYAKQWRQANIEAPKRFIATGYHYSDGWYNLSGIVNAGRVLDYLQQEFFVDRHIPIDTQRFLEIGCGNGRMTKYFADVFNTVYAVDVAAELLEKAKKEVNKSNIQWIANDGASLSFAKDKSADIIFSFIVFQHMKIPTILKYFEDIARVIDDGGLFIFQLPTTPIPKEEEEADEFFHVTKIYSDRLYEELRKLGFTQKKKASSALDYHVYVKQK